MKVLVIVCSLLFSVTAFARPYVNTTKVENVDCVYIDVSQFVNPDGTVTKPEVNQDTTKAVRTLKMEGDVAVYTSKGERYNEKGEAFVSYLTVRRTKTQFANPSLYREFSEVETTSEHKWGKPKNKVKKISLIREYSRQLDGSRKVVREWVDGALIPQVGTEIYLNEADGTEHWAWDNSTPEEFPFEDGTLHRVLSSKGFCLTSPVK